MTDPDISDIGPVTVTVSSPSDVVLSGTETEAFLASIGFDGSPLDETRLVVRELASNIVEHAGEGRIILTPIQNESSGGIEIRAEDAGPGITEVDRAVIDGVSTTESIGGGLGTVHRLMDEVFIETMEANRGTRIVARRWRATADDDRAPPIAISGVTRPLPGYDHNGDAFFIEHGREETLAGVIDGLGHGPDAHEAALTAERYLRTHQTESMADLFAGVNAASASTRGVVMSLARFAWDESSVEIGAVGNVGIRFCRESGSDRIVPRRGVLGQGEHRPRIDSVDWDPDDVLVLHSDGVPTSWACEDIDLSPHDTPADVASAILRTLAQPDDDATVLVAKGADA